MSLASQQPPLTFEWAVGIVDYATNRNRKWGMVGKGGFIIVGRIRALRDPLIAGSQPWIPIYVPGSNPSPAIPVHDKSVPNGQEAETDTEGVDTEADALVSEMQEVLDGKKSGRGSPTPVGFQ